MAQDTHYTNPSDTTCPCPAQADHDKVLFVGPPESPDADGNNNENLYDDPYFLYLIIFGVILLVVIGILCIRFCKKKKRRKPKQLEIVKTIESDSDKIEEDKDVDEEVIDKEVVDEEVIVGDVDENIKLLCNNINIA